MSDVGVDQQTLRKDAYTSLYFPQQHQVAVSGVKDVVRHGWLTKQGGRISTWKRRWCVLSAATGTLYYYKTQRDAKPAGFIPLDDCVVRRGGSKRAFAFEIAHSQRRVFSLFADTEPDLYSWLAALEHLIAALRDKALRDRDAVWLDLVRPSLLHSLSTPSSARSSPRGSVLVPPAGDAASARLRSASFESRPAVVLRTRSASVDQDSSSDDNGDDDDDDGDDDDDDSEATTEEINGEAAADDDDNDDDDDDDDDDDKKKNKKKKEEKQKLEVGDKKSRPQQTPSSDAPRRAASLLGRSQSSRKFTTLKEASLSDAQQRRNISSDRPTDLAALNETTMSTGIVSWRVLSALLGARALSAAHADALRFLLFATVLPTTKWLDKPQAPLDACSGEDLAFVTREQLNFFVHVFGPHEKWLSWCVPLSKCYHGAISAARAKTLLEGALVGSFLLRLTPAALPPITPAQTLHMIESEKLRPHDMPDWPEPPLLVFHCRTLEGIRELPVRREPNTLYHYLPGDTIWADLGALLKNTPAFVAPFSAPLVLWQEHFAKADAELRSGANRTISVGGDIVTRRRVKSRKLSTERDHRPAGAVDLSASAGDAPSDHPTSPRRVTVADQLKIAVARRLTTIRRGKVDAGADETPSAAPEVQLSPRRRLVQAQLELVMREKEKMEEQLAAKKLAEQAAHQELLAAAAQCPLTPAQVAHWLRERRVRAERAAQLLADERRVEIECAVARVEIAIAELCVVAAETPGAIASTTHPAVAELRLRRDELRRWVSEDDDDQTVALLASDDVDKELHSRAKAALHKVSGEATMRHLWRVVPLEKVTALLASGTAYDEDFSMSGSSLIKPLASANQNYARVLELELRRTLTNESDSAFLASHQRAAAATIVAETCGRVRFVGEVCDAQALARLQAL
jgi:hypothetical protein